MKVGCPGRTHCPQRRPSLFIDYARYNEQSDFHSTCFSVAMGSISSLFRAVARVKLSWGFQAALLRAVTSSVKQRYVSLLSHQDLKVQDVNLPIILSTCSRVKPLVSGTKK